MVQPITELPLTAGVTAANGSIIDEDICTPGKEHCTNVKDEIRLELKDQLICEPPQLSNS